MRKQQKKIDWSIFKTGQQFQSFCNKLLEFEIGTNLVPFGAKGPDKGIDAQFTGKYNNKEGKFTFNAKFLDPSMDKNRARTSLVQQLKGTTNRKGELQKMVSVGTDYYYVLTNVKITPTYREKIYEITKNYGFEVTIWGGEKLENLVTKHPLIYQFYFGAELPLFLGYEDFFSEELTGKEILNYDVTLYGRKREEEDFMKFLESEERILMVYGQGGIGKSRILIEFARIAEQRGWTQRFVRTETETFDDHLYELSPEKKYVLFLDDAQRYSNFSRLLSFINSENREKIKLVFSTRSIFSNNLRDKISVFVFPSKYKEMEVPALDNKEILHLLEELGVASEERSILCDMSKGIPLIAILAAQLRENGTPLYSISTQQDIQNLLNRYLNELKTRRDIQHVDLLRILAFLVPFSIGNENIQGKIAEILNISEIKCELIIQDLMRDKFIEIRAGKLKIVPNLMGEHLILQVCFRNGNPTGFHQKIIRNFIQLTPKQIITNLALIESKVQNKVLLDGFLNKIKREVLEGNNAAKLTILALLETLSYLRPGDTLDILKNVLKKETLEHVDISWEKITVDDSYIKIKAAKLLEAIANFPDTFEEAIDILKVLAVEEGGEKIYFESAKEILLNVCGIQYYRDIRIVKENRYEYRNVFRKMILKKLKSWAFRNELLDHIILEIIERQLEETIDWSEKSIEKKGRIDFFTWEIPEEMQLQQMRKEFFNVLFKIGFESPWASIRSEIPILLLRIWGKMNRRKGREEKEKEQGKELMQQEEKKKRRRKEKERMVQFLIKTTKEEKNWRVIDRIIETFRHLGEWEGKGMKSTAEQVLDRFEQDDEFQLYRVLAGTKDFEEVKKSDSFIKKKTKYFLQVFTAEELVQLLNRICQREKPESLEKKFFYELGVQSPDYALCVFQLLQKTTSSTQAKAYSGYVLGGLRVSDPQTALSTIKDLKISKNVHTIIDSYELMVYYRNLDESDLDLCEEYSRTGDKTLRVKICGVLPNFRHINARRCLEILENASYQATPQLAETILHSLLWFDFLETSIQVYKSIVMNFVSLENVFGVEFGFIMDNIIGYDPLFLVEFLEKRIEYKEKSERDNRKFEIVPFSFDSFKNFDKEKHLKNVLKRVRDWTEKGDLYVIKAPFIFWEICGIQGGPANQETASAVKKVLQEWIEEGSHSKLRDVAHLLLYSPPTKWVFELFEEIIEKSGGDQEILSSVSAAIGTTSEAEMISFGEPSPQALRQIELLKDMLRRNTNRHVKAFAKNKIREIQEFSKWMTERMEEDW